MKRIVVVEHGRIVRGGESTRTSSRAGVGLDEALYDRLRRFDQAGLEESSRVFDWRDGYARATQWVGVIQAPGVQVEILPKIDTAGGSAGGSESELTARGNLLFMLAVAGDVPVRARDVARLASRRAPLSETLAAIFASRLQRELLRGLVRGYRQREENLRAFKGKLVVSDQARRNAAHRERFSCRFEEFEVDTAMNRIFRAACRSLLASTTMSATQDALRRCLLLLEEVSDLPVVDADFDAIVVDRQNERFSDVLRFCRLVLAGRSPKPEAGATPSFSILFDMNRVFESFIAGFLATRVIPAMEGCHLYPQAVRNRRYLFDTEEGRGFVLLKPDLLVRDAGTSRQLVVDTKWKRPVGQGAGAQGSVSNADLYQLFAYAHRYASKWNVLLYPEVAGVEPRDYFVLDPFGSRDGRRMCIRHVNVSRSLFSEAGRTALEEELRLVLTQGLGLESSISTQVLGEAETRAGVA